MFQPIGQGLPIFGYCPKQNNFQLRIIHIFYTRYQAGGDIEILNFST